MTPPLVLVLGGARSGKSRFALSRAAAVGGERVFVATAEPRDAEMAARIDRHRAERGSEWRTREEPIALASALRMLDGGVAVVDCLTLWLANRIESSPALDAEIDDLVAALEGRRTALVLVSNEVGLGLVPDTPLGRAFRDAAGVLHQRIAAIANEVWLLVAGQPLRIR